MKKTFIVIFVILLALAGGSLYKNTNVSRQLERYAGVNLDDAKTLRYRLYLFGVIPVGDAIFSAAEPDEYDEKPVYHLGVTAIS